MNRWQLPDVSALRGLLATFPARLERDTETASPSTEERERWSGRRLLLALADLGRLDFPLTVEHDDKPDFRLYLPTLSVGVEISDLITEADAQNRAIRARRDDKSPVAMAFRWGDKGSKRAQRRLSEDTGWVGDEPEEEVVYAIRERCAEKHEALLRADFQRFEENWLYLHNEHLMVSLDKVGEGIELLREKPGERFDRLFVSSGPGLLEVVVDGDPAVHIPPSWL